MSIYSVDEYISRAKGYVEAGDENALRHACLELRFCIESIVYQKLSKVGKVLPRSVYKTWQPPQALKRLLSFEPRADKDAKLSFCLPTTDGSPSGEWLPLGDYKMFPVKWLKENYNRLGKFLHVPSLQEAESPAKITAEMLQKIIDEVGRVASSNLVISANSVAVEPCTICQSDMYYSQTQVDAGADIECYNDKCAAKHSIVKVGDKFRIERAGRFSMPCKRCCKRMAIEDIEHGDHKACWSCGQLHVFGWCCAAVPMTSND